MDELHLNPASLRERAYEAEQAYTDRYPELDLFSEASAEKSALQRAEKRAAREELRVSLVARGDAGVGGGSTGKDRGGTALCAADTVRRTADRKGFGLCRAGECGSHFSFCAARVWPCLSKARKKPQGRRGKHTYEADKLSEAGG